MPNEKWDHAAMSTNVVEWLFPLDLTSSMMFKMLQYPLVYSK